MTSKAIAQSDAVQKEQEQLAKDTTKVVAGQQQGLAVSLGNTKGQTDPAKELSQEEQAAKSKKEREAMQIPQRKDEVIAPGDTTGLAPVVTTDVVDNSSTPWLDYASKQEELYKKNTGQPIERDVAGRVKP